MRGLLLLVVYVSLVGRTGSACTGTVNANLAVTGAFTKSNDNVFSIKSNEYATFTCTGNADDEVEVESKLVVDCDDASKFEITSFAGTGAVAAKWQSNDGCQFTSECTIKCSASTDCDKTGVQEYEVVKVNYITVKQIDCSTNFISPCSDSTTFIQTLTRNKPLGTGRLHDDSTCEVLSLTNTLESSQFVVRVPAEKCKCETTFQYHERDSEGTLCSRHVYKGELDVEKEDCTERLQPWAIATIITVMVVLTILAAMIYCLFKKGILDACLEKYFGWTPKNKPNKSQVQRMTLLNQQKLSELIEVANNADPDPPTRRLDDPVYDEIH